MAIDGDTASALIGFSGNPIVAILMGLIIALHTLVPEKTPKSKVSGWLTNSIAAAGITLAITGAGGHSVTCGASLASVI